MVERELGEMLEMSIPTSVPFEKEIMQVGVNKKVDAVFINLRTLWRNLWTSFPTEQRPNPRTMVPLLIEEIEMITGLIRSAGLKHLIYYPSYKGLKRAMPNAKHKDPEKETVKQKYYSSSEKLAMTIILKRKDLGIFECDIRLPPFDGRVWIITHFPIDLLNRYSYRTLRLLESHTGSIKEPLAWGSKLTTNPDYTRIPFNIMSLQAFGEGNLLFGYSIKYKRALREMAEKDRWTPLTTKEKIVSSLKKYPNQEIANELLLLFKAKI